MARDIRFAFRTLLKNPGLSAVAIFILTLGIGANAVVFSLVHGLMLEPLPFEQPDRLVRFYGTDEGQGRDRQRVSELAVSTVRDHGRGLDRVAGAFNTGMSVTDSERPLNPLMRAVSEDWFQMLGVEARLGRLFEARDHEVGRRVAILHHGFWQSYFGGDPDVVGRSIELAEESYEVIGVMPASFRNPAYPRAPVLWIPASRSAEPDTQRRNWVLLGRLAADASSESAQGEADRLSREMAASHPETHADRGLRVVSLHDSLIERFRPALLVLFGAVGFVLLIACSNVANLLLARALGRRQEMAVRLALGAGRGHLVRQLMAESLVINLSGAVLGILVASWSLGPLSRLAPSNTNVPLLDRVTVHPEVVLFALGLAVVTSVMIGLVPLRLVGRGSAKQLSAGAVRSVGGRSRRRLRATLVIAELALSTVLLVGAGLTIRSLHHLRSIELGFDSDRLIVGRVGARGPGFEEPARWAEFHRLALDRLSTIPGVEGAAAIEFLPFFAGGFGETTEVAAQGSDVPPDARPEGVLMSTTPGFFEVHGQPILRGRGFTEFDREGGEPVAVISRELAHRVWGDADPVGQTLRIGDGDGASSVRVVGMVGDLRGLAVNPVPGPILYLPLSQRPASNVTTYLRTGGGLESLLPSIEDSVWSVSRDAPVYSFTTMDQMVRDLEWQPRFMVQLLSVFAVLALVLASTGIYSVLAYAVNERTREFGIRLAIGAQRSDIVSMVRREAVRLSVVGIGLGLVGAVFAGKGLESLLLGVSAWDPWTFATVTLLLFGIGRLAGFIPARRATRVDPVVALRDS